MITKKQRRNAERIVALDNAFGHLHYNDSQIVRELLNLTIPCAHLVVHEVVTGVRDSFDGVNDQAVADVERYCRVAVDRLQDKYGDDWWTQAALELELPAYEEVV